MTRDELFELAASVNDRKGFIAFIGHLNDDYLQRRNEWENDSLDQFLSGLSGFAKDIAGFYKNMDETVDVENITWRMAAQMLLAASVYEN